jgi:hypothetical protein
MSDVTLRRGLRREVPLWWALVSVVLAVLLMLGTGIAYTRYIDNKAQERERQADRRWCALLTLFDKSYQANPPETEVGREAARLMHELVVSTGCERT